MNSDAMKPSVRRRYLCGWGLNTLGAGLVFPLTAVYLSEHLGLSVFGVSLYFALFAVSGLVVNPVAGALCDRGRPDRIAVVATVIQAVGPVLLVLPVPGAHIAAALVSGAGTGIFYAVLTPLLIEVFGKDSLGSMLAAQNRVSAGTVGAGALLGGLLVGSLGVTGYRMCFVVNGVSYLLYGLVLGGVVRRQHPAPRPAAPEPPRPGGAGRSWAHATAPFTDRRFLWVLVIQGMLVTFGLGQIESVTPIVLRRSAELTVSGIGVVLTVNSIAVVALQGLVLKVVERLGHIRSLYAAVAFWTLSLAVLWLATAVSPWQARLALAAGYGALFAIGECLVSPSVQPIVVANAPPGKVASYSASTSLIHGISNLTAPSVCLPVFSALGFLGYLGLQFLGFAVAGVAVLFLSARAAPAKPGDRSTESEVTC